MSDVHATAAEGFTRGADTYVRGRPDFPAAALDWLREDLGLGSDKTAVDLGAGTGKFTRLLADSGVAVIAVEPVAAMLEHLKSTLPSVRTLPGTAQHIPLADSSVDAVCCAQAFHWFASAESLAEIRRVLKPGGVLGLIWNVRDQSVPWVAEMTRIMVPHEADAPRYDNGEWRRVFPARGFGELRERRFSHQHVGSPEQVIVDRVASVSFIAALDEPTRAGVLKEVRGLITSWPGLAGQATVALPYVTQAFWTFKA
jgi:SAM-dependent methyltransferase